MAKRGRGGHGNEHHADSSDDGIAPNMNHAQRQLKKGKKDKRQEKTTIWGAKPEKDESLEFKDAYGEYGEYGDEDPAKNDA